MPFRQAAPALGNQHTEDRVLRSFLKRALPEDVLSQAENDLRAMGRAAGGWLYDLQRADRLSEPTLTQWDAWGHRIDRIEVTRVWQEAERLAAEQGLVALAYEKPYGAASRLVQMALAYLFIPSTDFYGCPLAMTDGAARTLLASGNDALVQRAFPNLTSRNPEKFWTSGQWMTEIVGGSDVGHTETAARQDGNGTWRLYGRKWFTSAITSEMALALARPEGNAGGGKGLALFFVPIRKEKGGPIQNGITVNRLKEKLGTKKLPTAELQLDGAEALPVGDLKHGTRQIAPMLNVTRMWNAVTACALMRRGLALARDYAQKREAFGAPLSEKPLHAATLADLQATFEAAFHFTFRVVELLGRDEAESLGEKGEKLLRVLTPLAKLLTAKQSVAVSSEALEAFGGAGYVEDTGLPMLLRDAQVLPIWEGTTNVLALDTLRAVEKAGGLGVVEEELRRCAEAVRDARLARATGDAQTALRRASDWLRTATDAGRDAVETDARRFALTLGHALEAALLARHAQWALDHEGDARPAAAVHRFASMNLRSAPGGLDPIAAADLEGAYALANDTALPACENAVPAS